MNISTKLLVLMAFLVIGLGLGWHLRGNEDISSTLTAQKQEVQQGNVQNAKDAGKAQEHDAARAKTAERDRGVTERAAVAATAPDYHTCQLKPEDLALLNQAIGGDDGQSK